MPRTALVWLASGLLALIGSGCLTPTVPLPAAPAAVVHVPAASGPITLDGAGTEPAWRQAPAIALRTAMAMGHSGLRPAAPATVRLLHDSTHLLLLAEIRDVAVVTFDANRDDPLYTNDVFEVFVDANGSTGDYAEIEFSPRNAVFDSWIHKEYASDPGITGSIDWTCEGLRSAAQITADGYTLEIAIPAYALSPTNAVNRARRITAGERWRVNFCRVDVTPQREGRHQSWALIPYGWFHLNKDLFGTIEFE